MRTRPFAFLRLGDRWINMAMVTDIEDRGDQLRFFVVSDMARLAGKDAQPVDVARRFTIDDPGQIEKFRRWMMLNDED